MTVLLSIISILVFTAVTLRIGWSIQFNNEIKELFNEPATSTGKLFAQADLTSLPDPVQRYFNLVLKDGQPRISYARIQHDGLFRTGVDKEWMSITGEQYATTSTPGFLWKGETSMFTARDMYIADRGRLMVCLFSIIKIVDAKGESYNQGELLRWLGESVLYPTNLLPDERLEWVAIDAFKARLNFRYNNLELFYIVTFNAAGEITELETKRYMDKTRLETWIITMADYKQFGKMLIPTRFVVSWRLEKGDFSYAKFNITRVEYDRPYAF